MFFILNLRKNYDQILSSSLLYPAQWHNNGNFVDVLVYKITLTQSHLLPHFFFENDWTRWHNFCACMNNSSSMKYIPQRKNVPKK